jgi:hypothetical protein
MAPFAPRAHRLIALGVALLGGVASGGCVGVARPAPGPCDDVDARHVCSVPYELLYSDRSALLGKNVRVEGVLVVGTSHFLPGAREPAVYLFASPERAQACTLEHAVRVAPMTVDVMEEFAAHDGWRVSVAGHLRRAGTNAWVELQTHRGPSLTTGEQLELPYCLKPPPSIPPPPELRRG